MWRLAWGPVADGANTRKAIRAVNATNLNVAASV